MMQLILKMMKTDDNKRYSEEKQFYLNPEDCCKYRSGFYDDDLGK